MHRTKDRATRRRRAVVAIACAVGLAFTGDAVAASKPKQFLSNINAAQETPPVPSTAQGVAHLTFDETTKMLCFSISHQGLVAGEILAHIHGPALPGTPGGVVFPLPAGNPKSGCVGPLDSTQKSDLLKNLYYINIHSAAFPGGEIRGQILRIK
jgi:hypothetical protein